MTFATIKKVVSTTLIFGWLFTTTGLATEIRSDVACIEVHLNEPVSLGKEECVKLENTRYSIRILDFFNEPCPEGVMCVWSGVGILLEHRLGDKTQKGMGLVQVFGYQTTISETDYETFAVLSINHLPK